MRLNVWKKPIRNTPTWSFKEPYSRKTSVERQDDAGVSMYQNEDMALGEPQM